MDYRCPVCRANLGTRKFSQSITVGLETECPQCGSVIRVNVHPAETAIVAFNFAAIVALAAFAYRLQSRGLVLVAVGAGLAGAAALPVIERTWLRAWPRYLPMVKDANP